VLEWTFDSGPDPDMGYVNGHLYRPDAGSDGAAVSCYTSAGKVSRLIAYENGWRVETVDLSATAVDSLTSIAAELLDEGTPRKALPVLEAAALQRPKDVEVHTDLGHAYLEAGFYERAAEAFKKAISRGRKREIAEAFYGLGLVHLRDGLGAPSAIASDNAIEYFREALIRDQDHIQARFERAKARYLRGDPDSMNDIEGVINRNPQHAKACLLMGDWYANIQVDFEKAIEWYHRYAEMRPDDIEGQRALAYGYLRAGKHREILERFGGQAEEDPRAYLLAPIVAQACVIEKDPERAHRLYRGYLEKLEPEDRTIYEDIRLVASEQETQEYESLEADERQAFVRRFWNRRDSDLTTPVNERLLEHYRRIWHAREHFAEKVQPWDRRGDVYIRFGEPEHKSSSLEMNLFQDQKVQAIKERMALDMYGVAGVGETYVGPVFPVRSRVLEESVGDPTDDPRNDKTLDKRYKRWQLSGTPSLEGMGFTDMYGEANEDSPGGTPEPGWEITGGEEGGQEIGEEQIVDRSAEEDFSFLFEFNQYHPVTLAGGFSARVPWESWVYTGVGQGIEVTFTDEKLGGVYEFAPMPVFSASVKRDISLRQMAQFSRHVPETVFEREVATHPDYYWPRYDEQPIDFWFDHADFRGSDGRSALEVYCGVPNEVAHYADSTDVTRMTIRRRVALMPASGDTIYRASAEVFYQKSGDHRDRNAFVPDVVRLEVPPGEYQMEVRGDDEERDRLGIYRKTVDVEAYGTDSLRISDLELAWRITEEQELERFRKGDLEVIPMPTRSFLKGQPVSVYYEIYNLARDEFGQARYKVEFTVRTLVGGDRGGIVSRLVQSFTGSESEQVAIRYEQVGREETQVAYVELDMAKHGSGRYELRVEVTDIESGDVAAKETWFMVAE
jgi:GWxTD domain-containing protein